MANTITTEELLDMAEGSKKEKSIVPISIKRSIHGCRNCLWASIECKNGSDYKPSNTGLCLSYTYYD